MSVEVTKPVLRALIVEDNQDDFLLLVDQLEAGGINLESQRVDTEGALRTALQQPWDIVFSDFSMPGFGGARTLELVRDQDPEVPFIFVSGTIGEAAAVKAIKSGAQDYVMKSDLGRLVPTVQRELRDAEARREKQRREQTLRKLSLAISQTADSILITDANGIIEYVNPAFEMMTGYDEAEVLGRALSVLRSRHQDNQFFQQMWECLNNGDTYRGTLINQRKNGSEFYEEKVITPLCDENGVISHFVSTGRDISMRIHAEQARERLNSVLEATPDLVAIIQPDGAMLYLNRAGRLMLGLKSNQVVDGRHFSDVFPEFLVQQLQGQILAGASSQGAWSGEVWMEPESSSTPGLPVSLVAIAHKDGGEAISHLSLVARDISERKRFEVALQHQATHDYLTNLPNRYYLLDRLRTSIASSLRRGSTLGVIFIDLDAFKRINDTMGHGAGDELLKVVAQRLVSCLRPSDTIARLGGDEFTVIVEDLVHPESIIRVLSKFYQVFKLPVMVQSQEVFVTFSAGIALCPQDGADENELLRYADIAMYRAKASGIGQYRFYSADMDSRGREILQMEADLRYAMINDEFRVYYQPQIDVKSGTLVGVEALIRWQSRTRGMVGPGDFVPLLETSGLIVKVGEWVMRKACEQYHRFREAGYPDIRISVNVSAVQFLDPDFEGKVAQLIQESSIPPQVLELEITENIVMQDPARAASVLLGLNRIGVRAAIDDFGTGYSSLAYLKRFPLTTLKIDQTFVRDVIDDASDAAIVEASISLAHKLGMEVVAEGVETATQFEFLRQLNCNLIQGYWCSRPVPEVDLSALLGKQFF